MSERESERQTVSIKKITKIGTAHLSIAQFSLKSCNYLLGKQRNIVCSPDLQKEKLQYFWLDVNYLLANIFALVLLLMLFCLCYNLHVFPFHCSSYASRSCPHF